MDIVFIKELCIETIIGIYDWERKIKQVVCIDLEISTDISKASSTEEISNTVDYKDVSKKVKAFIESSKFLLIETLAEETIQMIFKEFEIEHIKGRFSKPGAVTGSKEVGVIIERTKNDQ